MHDMPVMSEPRPGRQAPEPSNATGSRAANPDGVPASTGFERRLRGDGAEIERLADRRQLARSIPSNWIIVSDHSASADPSGAARRIARSPSRLARQPEIDQVLGHKDSLSRGVRRWIMVAEPLSLKAGQPGSADCRSRKIGRALVHVRRGRRSRRCAFRFIAALGRALNSPPRRRARPVHLPASANRRSRVSPAFDRWRTRRRSRDHAGATSRAVAARTCRTAARSGHARGGDVQDLAVPSTSARGRCRSDVDG